MSEKLKPCPFCGKEPVCVGFDATGEVACCEDPACPGGTLGGHVNVWNSRPREERLVKLLREARHGIDRLHEGDCGGPAVEPCRWCRLRAAID
ncbi:MAG: hypothetical protein WC565_06310, partial [Parcubacteria group bacterium]